MEPTTRVGNPLLAALPPADFDLLAPYLRKVSLERDAVNDCDACQSRPSKWK
jgi:hypothetical protein